MAGSANNIVIDPVNVTWEIETESQVDFAGLTGLDVKGKAFFIWSAKDATAYYVWGDDSVVSDPAPAGKTGIAFTVTGDSDTATTLAAAAQTAINAESDFSATVSGTVVTIKNAAIGESTDTVDDDMGVAITICRRGKDFDLGLLEGDVELSFSPANFIVNAHQTGVTPRAALFQGFDTLEVSLTMQETQNAKLKELYKIYGDAITPTSSEVFGAGTSKQGNNLLVDAARLILKPVNASDDLSNKVLMLAIPIPDSLTLSGENPRTLSVTWQGFVDDTVNSNVSGLLFGDHTQAGLFS